LPYNGLDAKYHRLDFEALWQRVEADGLVDVYREKLRQVPTVVLTQIKGVPIDRERNKQLSVEYRRKVENASAAVQATESAKKFRRMTGQLLNPGSAQDIIVVLRDILKTREGQEGKGWSTKEEVLKKIDDPIAAAILAYRKVVKLKSTYVDSIAPGSPNLYEGDILHQNLGTCFVSTGRLESDDPNMQNWPIRTAEGKKVRAQVRKRKKGSIVASFDYGQIDARIIASGSRDKGYCKALWENYDIHLEWAHRLALFHPGFVGGKKFINDEKVMDDFRGAKVKSQWVFALFYGASLRTTAGRFGVDEDFLRPMYEEFRKQFSEVIEWQEKLLRKFEEDGYIQMFDGLRRRAPLGKGQIINTGVQMNTNRIVMHGMNRLSERGEMLYQPNMQIHDDLTYAFDSEREFEDAAPVILDTMLDGRFFDWFCVPLSVDIKVGDDWSSTEKLGTYNSVERLGWPLRAPEFGGSAQKAMII
jgi:DNA polymerase I